MAVPKMNLLISVIWSIVLCVRSQSIHPDPSSQKFESGDTYFNSELDCTESDCEPRIKPDLEHETREDKGTDHFYGPEHAMYAGSYQEFDEQGDYEPESPVKHLDLDTTEHDDDYERYLKPSGHVGIPTHREESKCVEETIASPYFDLCKRISLKLLELESRHPELRSLKLEFLERLDIHASDLHINYEDGESPVSKFLNLIMKLAGQLKEESGMYEHKLPERVEDIVAEEELEIDDVGFVGSVRGTPGVHYPNYTEVPITSFSCSDKNEIPGFYADLETRCQVFHVCYEHRRESFLCPIGTIFNQPILACDYWYSSDCSQAPHYYDVKEENIIEEKPDIPEIPAEPIEKEDLKDIVQFLPVKAKIVEYPKEPKDKVSVSSLEGMEVVSDIFSGIVPKVIPKPRKVYIPMLKPLPLLKVQPKKVIPIPFAKVIPFPAAKIVTKAKIAGTVPVVKAKLAKAVAVNVAKTKLVKAKLAKAVAVNVAKTKLVKAKIAKTGAVNVAKTKLVKTKLAKAVAANVKIVKTAKVPVVKAKVAVSTFKTKAIKLPVLKGKVVISPLTKKALALGYKKLLKSKKLIILG